MAWLGWRNGKRAISRNSSRRRSSLPQRHVESLEARTMLAGDLVISEVSFEGAGLVNGAFFELKGDDNGVINANTYLVTVSGDVGFDAGVVQSIFDLSGETLGSNGYLAVTMSASPYSAVAGGRVAFGNR